jgi:O-antigen/teichoic acid export membrane protein
MLAAYFIAPILVVFVLGEQYRQSIVVFQYLLIPMALFVGTIPSVNYLIYFLKKPFVSTINTAVQLVIVFLGNLYFIPRFDSMGPVWTLSLAYSVTLITATLFAFYYHRKNSTASI